MTLRLRILARRRRGAAELMGVLLIAAVAAAALAVWHADEIRHRTAVDRATAGAVFAAWMRAAHRAAQTQDLSTSLAAGGATLTPARIRAFVAAPLGLPGSVRGATMTLGVIPDAAGTGMAFAVLDPAGAQDLAGIRAGVVAAGITEIGETSHHSGTAVPHRAAIEAVLAAPLDPGTLVITADGLPVSAHHLYRRPQPGRPWLNTMSADLSFSAADVLAVDALTARSAAATGSVTAPLATVDGSVAAATMESAALNAAHVDAGDTLAIAAELMVGTFTAAGTVAGASAAVTGHLETTGITTGALATQDVTVGGTATVASGVAADEMIAGTVASLPTLSTASITAAGGVYWPETHHQRRPHRRELRRMPLRRRFRGRDRRRTGRRGRPRRPRPILAEGGTMCEPRRVQVDVVTVLAVAFGAFVVWAAWSLNHDVGERREVLHQAEAEADRIAVAIAARSFLPAGSCDGC